MAMDALQTFSRHNALEIRVADSLADFAGFWPRTDNHESAYCYSFQCADVLQIWCNTIGKARGITPVFAAVFDEAGRPILLLPLGIERQHGIRILRFLDAEVSDYNAPIVFEPKTWTRNEIDPIWRKLIEFLPHFDIASFDKMPADICGAPNPLLQLGGMPSAPSAHLTNLTGTWHEYSAKLPKRKRLIYQRRRLGRLGQISFKIAETSTDRQRILQAMMQQKSRRYIETLGFNQFDLPGRKQFYWAMTERFPWPGPLLIAGLELNGNILAAGWHFIFKKRFMYLMPSYEGGEWKRFSPGRLLLEDLIEWCYLNGITVFDFTFGDEVWKFEYSNQEIPLYQLHLPLTVAGRVYNASRKTWRVIKQAVPTRFKRACSTSHGRLAPQC